MQRIRTTALAGAILVGATSSGAALAQSNDQLLKELDALKKQVQELQQQQQKLQQQLQPAAAPTPAPTPKPETAQPTPDPATKADIDGLRGDLENYKYEQQRSRDTKTATTTRGTTIGGTVQVRATYVDHGATGGSTASATSRRTSFDIPSATLNFTGSLFRDYAEGRNLDYRLALAYASTSPATNNSNFNLTDAYLRYSPLPTTTGLEDPKLTVTIGQQQIPFGLEAQVGEELRPVINSAQFLNGLGVGTRQIGAIVRGDYQPYVDYGFNYRAPLLEYALGAVNGAGPNKSDDNGAKDYLGRVAVTLPVDYNSLLRELKFGASYYTGKKNLTRTAGTVTSTVALGKTRRTGFDVYYNHDPFGITYEYARGRDDALASATGPSTSSVASVGQYVTLYYQWGEQFVRSYRGQAKYDDWWPRTYQAFLRLDDYNPNKAVANNRTRIGTVGLNVFFAETTKFQINLARTDNQSPLLQDTTSVLAQFQYGF